eukprot:1141808-Pelagomonas_calceolata.AAC.3
MHAACQQQKLKQKMGRPSQPCPLARSFVPSIVHAWDALKWQGWYGKRRKAHACRSLWLVPRLCCSLAYLQRRSALLSTHPPVRPLAEWVALAHDVLLKDTLHGQTYEGQVVASRATWEASSKVHQRGQATMRRCGCFTCNMGSIKGVQHLFAMEQQRTLSS